MQSHKYQRNEDAESPDTPHQWIDRSWGAGPRSHIRVWIEKHVPGFDMEKWTVRKEQFDDDNRGQHKPTNLSTHSSKEKARKSAVEWMRSH